MSIGMLHLHHYLPFVLFSLLIINIFRSFQRDIASPKEDKLLLFTVVLAHLQLLIGLFLLFPFPEIEMSVIMKDAAIRFKYIEHPSMMLIAVILITIAKSKSKRIEDVSKANKAICTYFIIALVLIVLGTPWSELFKL
jgi:heme A synthase